MSLNDKRKLYDDLMIMFSTTDMMVQRLDAEWVRSKAVDRAALIIGGFVATMPLMIAALEQEISWEAEEEFYNKEFEKIDPPPEKPLDPPS